MHCSETRSPGGGVPKGRVKRKSTKFGIFSRDQATMYRWRLLAEQTRRRAIGAAAFGSKAGALSARRRDRSRPIAYVEPQNLLHFDEATSGKLASSATMPCPGPKARQRLIDLLRIDGGLWS
jgi:hypothetical protein